MLGRSAKRKIEKSEQFTFGCNRFGKSAERAKYLGLSWVFRIQSFRLIILNASAKRRVLSVCSARITLNIGTRWLE